MKSAKIICGPSCPIFYRFSLHSPATGSTLVRDPCSKQTPQSLRPNQSPAQTDNSALLELLVRNKELEEKVFDLKGRLADKEKLIALLEENKRLAESVSAVVTPTEARRDNPQHATSDRPASGVTDCGV